ncbi:MAG: TIGR03790 family protein [Opitutales bacterium]
MRATARYLLIFYSLFLGSALIASDNEDEAEGVVVLVNSNAPDSSEIAAYYTEKRGIPKENIIELDTSANETVSVDAFIETIHNPLLNKLMEDGWISGVKRGGKDQFGRERMSVAVPALSYLVTTRGIPLRIKNDPEKTGALNENVPEQFQTLRGSVDSELALLAGPWNAPMEALVRNPLFENNNSANVSKKRIIRVCRLDGPSAAKVKNLIDRTLEAEEYGLMGRAYFDLGGPHEKGDNWIRAARDLAEKAYFGADTENSKRAMGFRDRLDAPAIYMGWYKPHAYGPWRDEGWGVPPGAIAFHLHSFSATTVRSPKKRWLGPFVEQGYCAMVGNVYEPYIEYTHRPQILLNHMLEGRSFGEAAYSSNPALSWMGVAIGDPLYRPFQVDLDAQLKNSDKRRFGNYAVLRQINRLVASGQEEQAFEFARKRFEKRPSLPLAYRLAGLYAERDQKEAALKTLDLLAYMNAYERDELALVRRMADLMGRLGDNSEALNIYRKLINREDLSKKSRIFLLEKGAAIAEDANDNTTAARWKEEAAP